MRPLGSGPAAAGAGPAGGHGLTGVADAGAFLARLVRLDPAALVRLRPAEPATPPGVRVGDPSAPGRSDGGSGAGGPAAATGRTALWARLPWGVLAVRTVAGTGCGDAAVPARDLLAALSSGAGELPARRDAQWRWPLPPPASRPVELLPAGELWRIAEAAAGTLREAAAHGVAGRPVGQRVLRDALLDHVAVVVTPDDPSGPPVEIAQRLVQGLVRMGFLGRPGSAAGAAASPGAGVGSGDVQVRMAGRWVGLVGPYGTVWSQKVVDLAVTPLGARPKV
ncbi:hypothetical protein E1258_02760 [Micromonospora sp. KC207]|uniref:hypothetical protein n=1 Tax=Micromonospora sp. KC207 TaxID=2530377 RepID=UPI0010528909|nr:hypothetical protein [Micromonospora sp. KC207]TDC66418.1 hypothetical protein E1258_02760 [Micromonospora sp. KC207]